LYRLAYPECWQVVVATYRLMARDAKDMLALGASLAGVEAEEHDGERPGVPSQRVAPV
jgi:hypothetical protein